MISSPDREARRAVHRQAIEWHQAELRQLDDAEQGDGDLLAALFDAFAGTPWTAGDALREADGRPDWRLANALRDRPFGCDAKALGTWLAGRDDLAVGALRLRRLDRNRAGVRRWIIEA